MTHSTDETRRRFYHRWSPFERMVIIVLAFAVVSMVATPLVQRGVDRQQNALIEQRAKEARECLSDRIDAIHDYLDSRGELADRDRINENRDDVADNLVLQSFAEAARTGNNAPALRALARWEEAQEKIVAEEKRISRDREEKPLPEFPEGDCLKELEAITPGPTDEPKDDGAKDDGDGGVSSGSDSSSSSSSSDGSDGSPRERARALGPPAETAEVVAGATGAMEATVAPRHPATCPRAVAATTPTTRWWTSISTSPASSVCRSPTRVSRESPHRRVDCSTRRHHMSDHALFVLKGVIAFIAIMLYGFHLWQIRNKQMEVDQVARFIALFFGGIAVFGPSVDQIADGIKWEGRHLFPLAFVITLCVAAVLSIRAEHRRQHGKGLHEA